MTYKLFEDSPVWQAAICLAERVCLLTGHDAFQKQYSLRDQLKEFSGLPDMVLFVTGEWAGY